MSSSPEDARLALVPAECIPQLAVLYDRFANALDPFSPERDQAEMLFEQELARLYDCLPRPNLTCTLSRRLSFSAVVDTIERRTNPFQRQGWLPLQPSMITDL